ncbi:MAG: hypothetical protein WBL28_06285 [Methylotenera sp.]
MYQIPASRMPNIKLNKNNWLHIAKKNMCVFHATNMYQMNQFGAIRFEF